MAAPEDQAIPCDTRLKPRQTLQQRATEVRAVVDKLGKALASGKVKPIVSKDGGIAFQGLTDAERDGVSDACVFRRLLATGSPLALAAIAKAEALAGRTIDRKAITNGGGGLHAHATPDGKLIWHNGH